MQNSILIFSFYVILARLTMNIQGKSLRGLLSIFPCIGNACRSDSLSMARTAANKYKKKHPNEFECNLPDGIIYDTIDRLKDHISRVFDVVKEDGKDPQYTFNLDLLKTGPQRNVHQNMLARLTVTPLPDSQDSDFEHYQGKEAIGKALKLYAIVRHYYAYEFLNLDKIKNKTRTQNEKMKQTACSLLEVEKAIKELSNAS
ncbi:hypothetical protein DdX_11905 [Ditylenchus destructor]|uniref:Uncharacterized protein n=1 Tax=Ditylenchus destructor TaxID=166010 RepID=A0AAD4MYS8_9BILA|nr:hypothetical protein DdX_11905 [Ditylenchus destructor]